jgi:hypothetical protein
MTANEDSSEASATAVQRKDRARREGQMSIWQIGFVVRSGVSALAVAFLLNYSAQYEWGLSLDTIRSSALGAALIIGMLVAIDHNLRKLK